MLHGPSGVGKTRRIEEDARKKRIDDKARLEAIKQDFKKQYHMPPAKK